MQRDPRCRSARAVVAAPAEAGPKCRAAVQVWKWRLRHRDIEQLAERLPAIANVIDEQAIRRDALDHLVAMPLEDGNRMRALAETSTEDVLPDRAVDGFEHGSR